MINQKNKTRKRKRNYFKQQKLSIMNTTKKTIQLFFILALMSGGLWNLNSCKDDNSDILEKIDQVDKSLSDKIDKLSGDLKSITESLKNLTDKVGGLATKEDVAAVKGIVDKLTTSLTAVSTTVSGLKDAISDDVKAQLATQLTAIKTAMDALQTALEQKIATATAGTTKGDYQALLDQLKALKAGLDKVKADLDGATKTEKEHYDEIMKTLKAQNTYVIDDAVFADFLRADDGINKAFIFTNTDLNDSALLKAEGLTREEAKRYINKVHRDVISRKSLDISAYSNKANIKSLIAIKIFTALETLNAKGLTGLKELKFSNANYQLTDLNVSGDTALDDNSNLLVDKCTALKKLDASKTNIKGLNLSANSALEDLNLNGCSNLQSLDASNNHVLASLDVLGCSSLVTLDVSKTLLASLDISGSTFSKLKTVTAKSCSKLTTLSANRPNTSSGSIVTLDASIDYALITLTANNNSKFETLTLDNDSALKTLEADFASFSSGLPTLAKLGANNALETLKVSNTNLPKLDVNKNHNLVTCIANGGGKSGGGLILSMVLPGGTDFHSGSKELLEKLD